MSEKELFEIEMAAKMLLKIADELSGPICRACGKPMGGCVLCSGKAEVIRRHQHAHQILSPGVPHIVVRCGNDPADVSGVPGVSHRVRHVWEIELEDHIAMVWAVWRTDNREMFDLVITDPDYYTWFVQNEDAILRYADKENEDE